MMYGTVITVGTNKDYHDTILAIPEPGSFFSFFTPFPDNTAPIFVFYDRFRLRMGKRYEANVSLIMRPLMPPIWRRNLAAFGNRGVYITNSPRTLKRSVFRGFPGWVKPGTGESEPVTRLD